MYAFRWLSAQNWAFIIPTSSYPKLIQSPDRLGEDHTQDDDEIDENSHNPRTGWVASDVSDVRSVDTLLGGLVWWHVTQRWRRSDVNRTKYTNSMAPHLDQRPTRVDGSVRFQLRTVHAETFTNVDEPRDSSGCGQWTLRFLQQKLVIKVWCCSHASVTA